MMKEAELAPLTVDRTSAEGEDWWENDEPDRIIASQARWKDEQQSLPETGVLSHCRPWWIGLTIAALVVVGQVLVLSFSPAASQGERHIPVKGVHNKQTTYYVTPQGETQVQNFLQDRALMLNVHITHHGGTTICRVIGRALGSPTFACMGVRPKDNVTEDDFSKPYPWAYKETSEKIQHALKFFGMLSWEFGRNKARPLAETNWEEPHLVSVFVARHPIDRSLAHSGFMASNYKHIMQGNATKEEWWRFAKETREDNFALSMLTYRNQGRGTVTEEHLNKAKDLIRRFTFVLDLACLGESMSALADVLGITLTEESPETKPHPPPSERVPFRDVYNYLTELNKFDIELYEWSKSLSLVKCDELSKGL